MPTLEALLAEKDIFLRTPIAGAGIQVTAMPLPERVFDVDLPFVWDMDIGARKYHPSIDYNGVADWFTLEIFDERGEEILRPHPLMMLQDIYVAFQHIEELEGLKVVPVNLGSPYAQLAEGITKNNFGGEIKLYFVKNKAVRA